MENIVLTIHLLLALGLIGVVLLQRSEGGGLGIGGGGGGATGGRAAATALSKVTWVFAIGFLITSLSLTVIAANNSSGASVLTTGSNEPAPVENVPLVDPNAIIIPDLGDIGALPEATPAPAASPEASADAPATPPPAN